MRYRFVRFPEGKCKALTLSYDDGTRHDIRFGQIIDRYGLKATFNIPYSWMGDTPGIGHLTPEEIGQVVGSNHEIATHGAKHIAPGLASPADMLRDSLDCRRELERTFGGIIRGMAYPDSGITRLAAGNTVERIAQRLEDLGIAYARSLGADNDQFELPNNWYAWVPTAHHNNPDLMTWLDKFLEVPMPEYIAARRPKLFYVWGHSYEFENQQTWDKWEAFCQRASGHRDVWYATNIEICDYVKAYSQLQFNIENTLVYNPTAVMLWFEADTVLYKIAPGETIQLQ